MVRFKHLPVCRLSPTILLKRVSRLSPTILLKRGSRLSPTILLKRVCRLSPMILLKWMPYGAMLRRGRLSHSFLYSMVSLSM